MRLASKLIWVAVFVGLLVFGWRFAANHAAQVSVHLPAVEEIQLTLWLALLLATAFGAVFTALVMFFQVARLQLLARRYRKIIKDLESEVHELRNLPLAETDSSAVQIDGDTESDSIIKRALGRGA